MALRPNRRRIDATALAARLDEAGIATRALPGGALVLEHPRPAASLPGFVQGMMSVQDPGAQCAAPLIDARDGMRVLDACAAPGGKTAHVLEWADVEMTALDRDARRLEAVDVNLARLGLTATTRAADAADLAAWWDGRPFDRVLLDAPCTASGVVRRHPDGKWLKRPGDAAALADEQSRLLAALWQVLGPGGKLLYATCSVFTLENRQRIAGFLNAHPDAKRLPIDIPLAHRDGQLLPGADHDGFYYALLQKAS
jgi:16S rRNA (cytosine967-C5)-methyltransferase